MEVLYQHIVHLETIQNNIPMNEYKDQKFTIDYHDNKKLIVRVSDLLGAPVDTIVNPANSGLSHGGGLAAIISKEGGSNIDKHCEKIIDKYGHIPVTQSVTTTAGRLPFKGIIHAVGPRMGDGNEQGKIESTIIRCLKKADKNGWESIGFPAISTGLFCIPVTVCARAFKNAIPLFWEKYPTSSVKLIFLCLTVDDYPEFETVFQH